MGYLSTVFLVLPCLIGGLFLSIRDWRERKVSRKATIILFFAQLAWMISFSALFGRSLAPIGDGLLWCTAATAVMFYGLYALSHGNFGLGDVTAGVTLSLVLVLTSQPLIATSMWWFLSSLSAVITMRIRKEPNIAFVPFLYVSAIITLCLALCFNVV